MKALNLVLLLLVFPAVASAQAASDTEAAPGVAVLQHRWRVEVRNPALDEDPMRANDEQRDLARVQKNTIRENAIRRRQGQETLPPPSRISPARPAGGTSFSYAYEVKVSNTGVKTIRELVWEYVLFDPDTQREVGRHRHTSEASIRPGKNKNLVGHSTQPPANVVDAMKPGEPLRDKYSERVVIQRIEYDDGSVWQRASD